MLRSPLVIGIVLLLLSTACKKKTDAAHADAAASAAPPLATTPPAASTATPIVGAVPPGSPPPDGKYERVIVDGVTVPMINVINSGTVVLVDTDGKKPRSWEEQYKRKRVELPVGHYDLHKTNTNKNDTFDDDAIDKEGLWVIDAKGNISRH